MGVTYSLHARRRLQLRGITESDVENVLTHWHTRHTDMEDNPCFIGDIRGQRVRVVVRLGSSPPHIITVIWLD